MKKFSLATSAAAIALAYSGSAMATINLDTGVQTAGQNVYASELVIPAVTGTILGAGAAADQRASAALGATFGTGVQAFIRYDLATGSFAGTPTLASNIAARVAQVSQGGAGANYVIFAISPTLAGDPHLEAAEIMTMTAAGIKVTDQGPVNITYRLYETLTAAVNQTPLSALKTASGTLVSFANVINVALDTVPNAVADVSAANGAYTAFVPLAGSPLYSRQVSNFHATYTVRALATGAATTGAGDILGATNTVTIDGNWAAAANAHIHNNASCAGGPAVVGVINPAKTKATFPPLSAATITATHWYVCYEVATPNAIPIPVSDFTGLIDFVPANAGVTVADAATAPGKIVRNGTVLKAAFAEVPFGSVSGTVNLSNTSINPAPFTTSCLTSTGRVAGNPGTVAANSAARFGIGSAAGLACPSNTRGLELTFAVPTGNVIGSVVRQNSTTGEAGFDAMTGNQ